MIRVDAVDANNASVVQAVESIGASWGVYGQIRIFATGDPSRWLLFQVVGLGALDPGYRSITVSIIDSSGASPFALGDAVTLVYLPALHTATGVAAFVNITRLEGSSGQDMMRGPPLPSVTWTIDGPDSGTVADIAFSSFEQLVGTSNNSDAFIVTTSGSVSGSVAGGTGGQDALLFYDTAADEVTILGHRLRVERLDGRRVSHVSARRVPQERREPVGEDPAA